MVSLAQLILECTCSAFSITRVHNLTVTLLDLACRNSFVY